MTFFYPLRNKHAFEIFDKAYKEKESKTVHVWSPQGFIRVQPVCDMSTYDVVRYIEYVPHIQLEGIKYEEIHRDTY